MYKLKHNSNKNFTSCFKAIVFLAIALNEMDFMYEMNVYKIQLALSKTYSCFVIGINSSVHIFDENLFFCVHSRLQAFDDALRDITVGAMFSYDGDVFVAYEVLLPQMFVQFFSSRKRFITNDALVVSRLNTMNSLMGVVMSFHIVSEIGHRIYPIKKVYSKLNRKMY